MVLELGGSDPFIVTANADMAAAIETAVKARIVNSGQSCIAAKRFIVTEAVADAFERGFTEKMRALKVGDPLDPATEVGPLATRSVLTDLDDQVKRSVAAGARVLTGGKPLDRPGNYYAPTVLADVRPGTPGLRRGALRAGRRAVPRARHRRSDSRRERHVVRPRLERVDE